jgi:hypothetical protein
VLGGQREVAHIDVRRAMAGPAVLRIGARRHEKESRKADAAGLDAAANDSRIRRKKYADAGRTRTPDA